MTPKSPKIIFVGNYKGGVGKTTSVLNFAICFSKAGKKVLTIDLDPQSSLSELLTSNNGQSLNTLPSNQTLNYIFDLSITKIKKYKSIKLTFSTDIIQTYEKGGFDFIASSLFYEGGGLDNLAVKMEDNLEYLSILKTYVDDLPTERQYDYIFIDCPPSNNLITRSAFLMSDYYIIPTILDRISAHGVAHYINVVNNTYSSYCENGEDHMLAKHYFGNKPLLLGIFFTMIRKTVDYSQTKTSLFDLLKNYYSESPDNGEASGDFFNHVYCFEEEINNFIDIVRSTENGDISKFRQDYEHLSTRVLSRIEELDKH